MKLPLLLCCLLAGAVTASSEVIVRWTFNSPWPDGSTTTGTLEPLTGSGYASVVGEITSTFSSGDTATGHDPAGSVDNSAWSTGKYPSATNVNKAAGVRFDASTADYEQINVSWEQRNSNTASRYTRFQYTLNGVEFLDGPVIQITEGSIFQHCTVSLAGVGAAANNPMFGFRLVTEWESTALGTGVDRFVATEGTNYSTSGTMRFDVVTVSGNLPPGGNNPPYISSIQPQTLRVEGTSAALPFTVMDAEDPAATLSLSANSSNPAVVPPEQVQFGGSGPNRTVVVKAGSQEGTATVQVIVTDQGGKSARTSFEVTVLPKNCAPIITQLTSTNLLANSTLNLPFQIGDSESAAGALSVIACSSNQALIPPSGLVLGGSGSNRWLTLHPAAGETGVSPIFIEVSDGEKTACTLFPVLVRPSAQVLLFDSFTYPDGAVISNSAGFWYNRSGIEGQTQVTAGELPLLITQTEDISAALPGGPYAVSNHTVLYASFRMMLPQLPKKATGPFAHFGSGSSMLGRLYVSTTNAASGHFRMLVSNGSGVPVILTEDLQTNTDYRIVLRYNIDRAQTCLWVNPQTELYKSASAEDALEPNRISSFGFRQGTDIGGDLIVDDLRIGLSFAAVLSSEVPPAPRLVTGHRSGDRLVLRWEHPGATLQYGFSPGGPFFDLTPISPCTQELSGSGRYFRLK